MRSASVLDLEVVDTVLEPPADGKGSPVVRVRMAGATRLYRVRIYLEGNDVPFVRSVTYHLHHSFPDPRRTVGRSSANPSCELVIWTWGIFDVRAELRDKDGRSYEVVHPLQYGEELTRKVTVVKEDAAGTSSKPKLRG